MKSRSGVLLAAVSASIVTALVIGGLAWATIPAADGTISACYDKQSGMTRIYDPSEGPIKGCGKNETPITWSQTGPQGEPGDQGEPGPQGPAGPEGPAGGLAGREVVSTEFTVPQSTAEFTYVATATCTADKVVLGGGYEIEQAGVNELRESHPEVVQPGVEAWRVGVGPDDDVDVDGVVYAICADS
jgi:hypothetical protein